MNPDRSWTWSLRILYAGEREDIRQDLDIGELLQGYEEKEVWMIV
jgi:hypothetical protein